MKVILNVDAITAPLTGIGRYALELGRVHHLVGRRPLLPRPAYDAIGYDG